MTTIRYARNNPSATLASPVATRKNACLFSARVPNDASAIAIAVVIMIMPAIVPAPNTSRYTIAHVGSARHFRADKPQRAGCRKRRLHPLSEDVAHQEERGERSPEMHRGIQVVDQLRADHGLRQDQLDGRQRVAGVAL